MRRLGHSVNKIAEHFKCSRPLVYKILASAGME
jgi:transposase